ncbi:MAG: SAM-dependent methyltransferase [Clostridia bacterium]|nr:SAM-dependent methyltransferase [Clostridia bacterium]
MEVILSPRLLLAASLVRNGAILSDVGTDHALLPAHLLLCGKIKRAIASDIVKGPLQRAEETVRKYGLQDRVATVLTPGLAGIEAYHPTDIVIAGMGGETIAQILRDAPFVKDGALRLILQPMTKGELLRDYLSSEGFLIEKEYRVKEEHRIYTILQVHYDGTPYHLDGMARYFGAVSKEERDELYYALLEKKKEQLLAVIAAKEQSGVNTAEEQEFLSAIEEQLPKTEDQ